MINSMEVDIVIDAITECLIERSKNPLLNSM